MNIKLVLPLIIGVGLAGCGSGTRNGSDGLTSSSDGGVVLPDGAAAVPDGTVASADAATPASVDVGKASEAGASGDHPNAAFDGGREAAVLTSDGSVDMAAAPVDGATPMDGLPLTPDAVMPEAPSRPDAVGFEAGKPVDAVASDTSNPATDLAPATLHEISPQDLHAELANKDFLLIDVHTPNAGSIPGTDARIAYTDIAGLVAFIGPDLNTKVVLTCLSGGMSKQAGNALVALGYRNIWELTGGMTAWTAAGYPLVRLDAGL